MTERAEKIVNATMELTLRPKSKDRQKVIAAAFRKLNDVFDEEGYGGDEPCCCVFRDIVDIIDELEAL
jgi:predicted fused transcriptional regulator/phosphomethylpyrimidine kinase